MDSLLLRPFASSPRPRLFSSPSLRGGCSRAQYSVQQELRFGRIQGCLNSSRRFGRIQGCLNSSRRFGRIQGSLNSSCATVNSVRLQKSSHVKSTSGHSLESEPDDYTSASKGGAVLDSLHALYKFSRPHTIIGTALSIVSVSLLAVENLSDISPCFFAGLLEAVVAALFMNIYIVGLNQLFDIEIDKVNKPDLPLASGEYSIREGITIIAASAVMSFGIGWIVGSWPLFWALLISFILGTAYSINLPFFRWKRFAVVAAMCILVVRAVIVQLAFFLHMQVHHTFVFRRPVHFSRPLIFATAFMSCFAVVIALFKDIPDIDGDQIFGIRSFSVRLGQEKVFWICITLLEMAYAVAMFVGASSSCLWSKCLTILGHVILASVLWNRARSLDSMTKASITSFYMFVWKLFYAEYLLIPFVR